MAWKNCFDRLIWKRFPFPGEQWQREHRYRMDMSSCARSEDQVVELPPISSLFPPTQWCSSFVMQCPTKLQFSVSCYPQLIVAASQLITVECSHLNTPVHIWNKSCFHLNLNQPASSALGLTNLPTLRLPYSCLSLAQGYLKNKVDTYGQFFKFHCDITQWLATHIFTFIL